jgi:D-serine deaminase-like pyridoxal phosphate-dependent protein
MARSVASTESRSRRTARRRWPELFRRQLRGRRLGITAATPGQARIFRAFGVERILLANRLVEPAAIRWVAAELASDPL